MEVAKILKICKSSLSGSRESCGPGWMTVAGMMRIDIDADVGVSGYMRSQRERRTHW
jgi:hypothetical protein